MSFFLRTSDPEADLTTTTLTRMSTISPDIKSPDTVNPITLLPIFIDMLSFINFPSHYKIQRTKKCNEFIFVSRFGLHKSYI